MIKLVSVVGARPQFIKAAALHRAVKKKFSNKIHQVLLHTGQHYDDNMSKIFFEELELPGADYNLGLNNYSPIMQLAKMFMETDDILKDEKPDAVLVYGDTTSTLAGAMAAQKNNLPLLHVEAGMRSFNKDQPEEKNRVMTDHLSSHLFCSTQDAVDHLRSEGIIHHEIKQNNVNEPGVFMVGDLMADNIFYYEEKIKHDAEILSQFGVESKEFFLSTLHRADTADDANKLKTIFEAFEMIATETNLPFIIPIHPRTKNNLPSNLFQSPNLRLKIIEPVSYLNMIALQQNAKLVFTDSGGMQKESFLLKTPCIVLRNETEWTELVQFGNNLLCGTDKEAIYNAFKTQIAKNEFTFPSLYGEGDAAEKVCKIIVQQF